MNLYVAFIKRNQATVKISNIETPSRLLIAKETRKNIKIKILLLFFL